MDNVIIKEYQELCNSYYSIRTQHLYSILSSASALLGALIALSDNEQKSHLVRGIFALSVSIGILGILLIAIGGYFDTLRAKRQLDGLKREAQNLYLSNGGKIVSHPPVFLRVISLIGIFSWSFHCSLFFFIPFLSMCLNGLDCLRQQINNTFSYFFKSKSPRCSRHNWCLAGTKQELYFDILNNLR